MRQLVEILLKSPEDTEAIGARLADMLEAGDTVFLNGQLGAGKTTLVRGVLRQLGHAGAVKSPTYTLVEPYDTPRGKLYHFDLYRIADPEELEYMGMRDYLNQGICLIEWAERAREILPNPDLDITLNVAGNSRKMEAQATTLRGDNLIDGLQ